MNDRRILLSGCVAVLLVALQPGIVTPLFAQNPQTNNGTQSTTASDIARATRVRSIQKRLQLLEKIIADTAQARSVEKPPQDPLPVQELPNIEAQPKAAPTEKGTAETKPPRPSLDNAPAAGSAAPTANTDLVSEFGQPVDARELANSLFLAGNWDTALEQYLAYQQQNPKQYAADDWAQCLTAHCFREQGDWSKAEAIYRALVASDGSSYSGRTARWYLAYLTQKRLLLEDFKSLSDDAQSYVKPQGGQHE